MPKGSLLVHVSKLNGHPVGDRVSLEFRRFSGDLGAGGASMQVSFKTSSDTAFNITNLPCRGGPGTMYRVEVRTPHHRVYSFFQSIQEDTVNQASDDVEFWVKPGDVKDIQAPQFAALPPAVRRMLTDAEMVSAENQDRDLEGEHGTALYQKLGPLRKACLLNIAKKASHPSAAECLSAIQALMICRQDRFFAFVDDGLPDTLRNSPVYKSAPNSLHEPLSGFAMTGESFKSRDAHANLQVTFMRQEATGRLAADIDIDESSGVEHGFEVIRNAVFRKRTNPYLIREFMLNADLAAHSLDPGYEFLF